MKSKTMVDLRLWLIGQGVVIHVGNGISMGIPSMHACATIGQLNGDHYAYMDNCYKKDAYMRVYTPMVHPMPSEDLCPKTNLPKLMSPLYHKQPGRIRKKRIKSASEPPPTSNPNAIKLSRYNLETKCSICKQVGHNRGNVQGT